MKHLRIPLYTKLLPVMGVVTMSGVSCEDINANGGVQDPENGAERGDQPNIILILADDMGYNDAHYNGQTYIETPYLDSLALNGVRMESFYTCPVSSPTRVGTLTGRYPIRMGLQRSAIAPHADYGIPADEELIPQMLERAGYEHRAAFGKWHVGQLRYEWLPMQRGFNHYVGCYNGAVAYFTHIAPINDYGERDWHYGNTPLDESGTYVTDLIGNHAAQYVSRVPKTEPFFMYLAFTAPHSPFVAKPEDIAKYNAKGVFDTPANSTDHKHKFATYAAMVDNMDQNIGKVIEAVRRRGDLDNTLILFYSDNGPDGTSAHIPTVMREQKFSAHEGGIRVVAFANWEKGGITGGRQEHSQMGYIDMFPTIKAAAYGDTYESVPDKKPLDGINILPILQGKAAGAPRYWYSYIDQLDDKHEHFALNYGITKLHVKRASPDNNNSKTNQINLYNLNPNHSGENTSVNNPETKAEYLEKIETFKKLQPKDNVGRYSDGKPKNEAGYYPKDWNVTQ